MLSLPNFAVFCCAALFALPAFASHVRRSPTAGPSHHSRKLTSHRRASHRIHGQQAIAPERATEIQQALIREHYLSGDASGKWDATTESAMQKYQADHGWQTKLMPDSRAIKSLGLGPDYSNAINAKNSRLPLRLRRARFQRNRRRVCAAAGVGGETTP